MPISLPTLADLTIRTMSNPEFESQLRQAYTTSGSAWWVSREGFHFLPDTNAQTTAARGTGPRRHILNETFPLNHPTPVVCLDIEPEDL